MHFAWQIIKEKYIVILNIYRFLLDCNISYVLQIYIYIYIYVYIYMYVCMNMKFGM
jgi:hypothetical protein